LNGTDITIDILVSSGHFLAIVGAMQAVLE